MYVKNTLRSQLADIARDLVAAARELKRQLVLEITDHADIPPKK